MSTDRQVRLSPQQLALKAATRDAVRAAGGQEFVAGEVGRTQSRISDYCSPNVAEFMPLDIVAKVEALGAGSPEAPHITRALARASGVAVVDRDAAGEGPAELAQWLAAIAGESGDVIRGLAAGVLHRGAAAEAVLAMKPDERHRLACEVAQLVDLLVNFSGLLGGCAVDGAAIKRADSS
jgi:hypothetical protein